MKLSHMCVILGSMTPDDHAAQLLRGNGLKQARERAKEEGLTLPDLIVKAMNRYLNDGRATNSHLTSMSVKPEWYKRMWEVSRSNPSHLIRETVYAALISRGLEISDLPTWKPRRKHKKYDLRTEGAAIVMNLWIPKDWWETLATIAGAKGRARFIKELLRPVLEKGMSEPLPDL